jgi:hypothetical protein
MEAQSPKEPTTATKTTSAKALYLPPTPSGSITNSPENFFAYGKQLNGDQWSRTRGYLYRLIPAIRRKPSYIDRFSQPIDEDYILRHKLGGSGRYQIMLNDRDGAGTFCKCILDLNDPEYPPRYNIHELDLTSDDNRQLIEELKQEGRLNQNGDVIEAKASEDSTMAQALKDIAIEAMRGRKEQAGGNIENQAMGKMLDMMSNASSKSIEIALGQVKREDPASFMALLTTAKQLFTPPTAPPVVNPLDILAKAKEIFAPSKSDNSDPLMKLLMGQLEHAQKDASAERQRNHELQLKMLEAKATATDPLDMVQKVLTLQEKLGGGESRNWKEKLVDEGLQYVPDIIGLGKQALTRYQTRPAAAQQQQRPQESQPSTTAQPTTENAQQQTQQAQPGADTHMPEPQPPSDPEIAFLLPIMMQQGHHFVNAFRNDPTNGGPDLASSVILFAGAAVYERIARMGQAKIIETIKLTGADGAMYKDLMAVGTEEMLAEFIEGFIDGPEPEEYEDKDEQPVATQRPPRKKKEQPA